MAVHQLPSGFVAACDRCDAQCYERSRTKKLAEEIACKGWNFKRIGYLIFCPECVANAEHNKAKDAAHGPLTV